MDQNSGVQIWALIRRWREGRRYPRGYSIDCGPFPSVCGESSFPGGEACLLYRRGDGGFEVGELKEHILVGRDQGADFRIENRRVSREHLRIRQTGETFLLEDVGSLNGTWVNGERICRRELRDGDILEFGGEVLVFCGPVEPSDSAMSGNPPRPQRNH